VSTTLQFSGAFPSSLAVRLVRCGVITGRVLDQQGQPVRGAMVYVLPKPADGGPLRPVAIPAQGSSSQVDATGRYRLFYLPPGQYAVAVTYGASSTQLGMTGFAPVDPKVGSGVLVYPDSSRPQLFTISGGEEYREVNFNLLPTAFFSVSGKVEIPSGIPALTRFWLSLASVDQPSLATAATNADAEGNFRFEGIASGLYYIFVSGPASARGARGAVLPAEPYFARTRVAVAGQNIEELSIMPAKARPVSFVLRGSADAKGACPPSAQLALVSVEDWAAVLDRSVPVNQAQEQPAANLAPAMYRMRLNDLGDRCYQASSDTLDLSQGPGADVVTVKVAPAAAIRGKLAGVKEPAGYVVALWGVDAPAVDRAVQFGFVDAQAQFAFGALPPGRYYLSAQRADAAKSRWLSDPARMLEIEVAAGAITDITLPVAARSEEVQ
jgi:hypothetical protein